MRIVLCIYSKYSSNFLLSLLEYIEDWRKGEKAVPISLVSIDNWVSAFCTGTYITLATESIALKAFSQ